MRKLICFIVGLMMVMSFGFADTTSLTKESKNKLIDTSKYILKTVQSVPEGTTPLVINNQKELDDAIAKVNSINNAKPNFFEETLNTLLRSTTGIVTKTSTKQEAGATVKLVAQIEVYSDGSFREITGCSEYTEMTGYVLGMEWRQNDTATRHTISNNKATIYGAGYVDQYLLINGFIKLYTTAVSLPTITYTPY